MTISVDLRVEDAGWEKLGNLETLCDRALNAAGSPDGITESVDVLLADDATLEQLNTDWRGKAKPTDVLSFPAGENPERFLGDIAIAYGVASRDAADAEKPLENHLCHLLIHGILHLRGHDHIEDDEAEVMEALEREALSRLGIADPYSRIAEK